MRKNGTLSLHINIQSTVTSSTMLITFSSTFISIFPSSTLFMLPSDGVKILSNVFFLKKSNGGSSRKKHCRDEGEREWKGRKKRNLLHSSGKLKSWRRNCVEGFCAVYQDSSKGKAGEAMEMKFCVQINALFPLFGCLSCQTFSW